MTLTIVSLLPRLQNTNGDAENAAVLARRARWAGLEAAVVPVERRARAARARVDAIVLGSGDDSSLEASARRAARRSTTTSAPGAPRACPILAVGTGWELLSWGIERHGAGVIEGLGILPGRAVPRDGARHRRHRARRRRASARSSGSRTTLATTSVPRARPSAASAPASATGAIPVRRASSWATSSAPTCTGRCSRRTPRSPIALLGVDRVSAPASSTSPAARAAVVDAYAAAARESQLAGVAKAAAESA